VDATLAEDIIRLEDGGLKYLLPKNRIKIDRPYDFHPKQYKEALNRDFPGVVDVESDTNIGRERSLVIRLREDCGEELYGKQLRVGDLTREILRFRVWVPSHKHGQEGDMPNEMIIKNLIPGWSQQELDQCLKAKFARLRLKGEFAIKSPRWILSGYFTKVRFQYDEDADNVLSVFGCDKTLPAKDSRVVFENIELWFCRASREASRLGTGKTRMQDSNLVPTKA
jgi:hypothetical protein